MKKFFGFILSLFFSLSLSVAASAPSPVFVTEEQSIKPGVVSAPITLQFQDSSGSPVSLGETSDLYLESSSASGDFSSSASSWQSATKMTINSNWTSRTFYYRDTSSGTFTLHAKIIGRTSLKELQADTKISISESAAPNDNGSNGEVLSATTNSSESTMSATTGTVAQASYITPNNSLEVTIGSDRLTAPGSPISLQVFVKKNSASANSALNFNWSFGDGSVGVGALVSHTYRFPGDYVVVLNARTGNVFAVSRIKVKVVEPNLVLSLGDNRIDIANNSNSEINLFNWKIVKAGRSFIFQPDTIILPKSKISIEERLLQTKGETEQALVLKNSLGQEVTRLREELPMSELDNLATQLVAWQSLVEPKKPLSVNFAPKRETKEVLLESTKATSSAETLVPEILYEASTDSNQTLSWWQKIWGWFD